MHRGWLRADLEEIAMMSQAYGARLYAVDLDSLNSILAENWWAIAIRGLLGIAFGVVSFIFPGATILSIVLVFSAYLLVDGIFAIVSAVRAARRHDSWGLLTLEGILNIATALIAFFWPGLTVLAFVLITAAWAIV